MERKRKFCEPAEFDETKANSLGFPALCVLKLGEKDPIYFHVLGKVDKVDGKPQEFFASVGDKNALVYLGSWLLDLLAVFNKDKVRKVRKLTQENIFTDVHVFVDPLDSSATKPFMDIFVNDGGFLQEKTLQETEDFKQLWAQSEYAYIMAHVNRKKRLFPPPKKLIGPTYLSNLPKDTNALSETVNLWQNKLRRYMFIIIHFFNVEYSCIVGATYVSTSNFLLMKK
jgi:hypothetical protein